MKALVGVTASGKTSISCLVAERIAAEILCVDSMTVYRGLDIGTAKATVKERARVPHHLLDIAEIGQRPTASIFAEAAEEARIQIQAEGRLPLVVGGSGLYLRAVLDGLSFAPTDPAVRAEIEAMPPDQRIKELIRLEPDVGSWLDLRNPRRVVRALEIARITGQQPGAMRSEWRSRSEIPIVGLQVSQTVLEERVERRIEEMFTAGWLDECRRLADAGLRQATLATGAIGYREVFKVLDGSIGEPDAKAEIARATLKLAKKQMTWFRADPRIRWVDADDLEGAAERVLDAYSSVP